MSKNSAQNILSFFKLEMTTFLLSKNEIHLELDFPDHSLRKTNFLVRRFLDKINEHVICN
jgi:hypothetical protein